MKRVAMVTVALALSMLVVGQALAQRQLGQRGQRERPEGARMQAMGPMAGVMMAVRGLELNEEQRGKVRGILTAAREELQELFAEAALSEDQQAQRQALGRQVMEEVREGKIERAQARERMAEATASVQTAEQRKATAALQSKVQEVIREIKGVLTTEQAAQLDAAIARPMRWGAGADRPERPERPDRARGEERVRGERPERPERPERGEGRRTRD